MKFKVKIKDSNLRVKVKIAPPEVMDTAQLDRFNRLLLRGFLQPSMLKKNQYEYTGPVGFSLSERLTKPITKREFLFIIEHIIVAVQMLRVHNLPIKNLIMTLKETFYNDATKELHFIYLPLTTALYNVNLIAYIDSIAMSAKISDDPELITRFRQFFSSLVPFSIDKLEAFIRKEDNTVISSIKKQNGAQSGFITNKKQHYYDHYENKNNSSNFDEATGLLEDDPDATGIISQDDEATGLLGFADEDATGLLSDNSFEPFDDDATGLLSDNSFEQFDDEATGLLADERKDESGFCDATTLLTDDDCEGTSLLVDNNSQYHFPSLYRVINGETISVNKPVYRLGKERSYVDYFVTNNVAVSRSHADIITRGRSYFVVDLNSSNHTYINDRQLPIHFEVEIFDGDKLRLGNEEFIFKA